MILLRRLLGDALRRTRQRQRRTLREVSAAARVSLGYLSEVERGQKEASSELLASICEALDVRLADLLDEVSLELHALEPVGRARVVVDPVVIERPASVSAADGRGLAASRAGGLPLAGAPVAAIGTVNASRGPVTAAA